MRLLFVLSLFGFVFSACGIKGPPLPPLDKDQKVESKEPVMIPTPTPTVAKPIKKLKKNK